MPTILVHVMPKPEILDPQGKAVGAALARLGFSDVEQVRQGKRFEITVEGEVTDAVLERVREAATTVLSNPVIEDVVQVKVVGSGCGCGGHGGNGHGHGEHGHGGHGHGGHGLTRIADSASAGAAPADAAPADAKDLLA